MKNRYAQPNLRIDYILITGSYVQKKLGFARKTATLNPASELIALPILRSLPRLPKNGLGWNKISTMFVFEHVPH